MASAGGESSRGARSGPIRLKGSRRGPVAAAFARSVEEASGPDGWTPEQRVWHALAERIARVVDAAWSADDVERVVRATRELRELVDLLPLRGPSTEGGTSDSGDGGDSRGDARGGILELVESGPTLGH